MTEETATRDGKGRFTAGNHEGGIRKRIDILEGERAELRQALAHEREQNAELKQALESGLKVVKSNFEQMEAHERELREAAEAERDSMKKANPGSVLSKVWADLEDELDNLRQYATRLLAALTQQRQALSNRAGYCWHCSNYTGEDRVQGGHGDDVHEDWCQIGALATDTDTLLAEGESLGVTP